MSDRWPLVTIGDYRGRSERLSVQMTTWWCSWRRKKEGGAGVKRGTRLSQPSHLLSPPARAGRVVCEHESPHIQQRLLPEDLSLDAEPLPPGRPILQQVSHAWCGGWETKDTLRAGEKIRLVQGWVGGR